MVISILGFAKSGKTSLAEELIRTAVARGVSVAAIKAGRRHRSAETASESPAAGPPDGREAPPRARVAPPDSRRFLEAGAEPVLFWTAEGITVEWGAERQVDTMRIPLPGREEFGAEWRRLVPAPLREELLRRNCVLIEGRWVPGALVVQMLRSGPGVPEFKYAPVPGQLTVTSPKEIPTSVETILRRYETWTEQQTK